MEEDIYAAGLFDGEGTVTLSTATVNSVIAVAFRFKAPLFVYLEFLQTH